MNDTSKAIVQLVHVYNKYFDPEGGGLVKLRAAYTFDAGPNAVIFCRKEHQLHLLAFLLRYFPTPTGASATYSNKPGMLAEGAAMPVEDELLRMGDATGRVSATNSHTGSGSTKQSLVGDVKMVYCTGVGDGPRVLGADESLVNMADGTPKPMPPKPTPVSRDASASVAGDDESQFKPVWVTSLEKTIKDNHRDMKELIKPTGPSIPSTYQVRRRDAMRCGVRVCAFMCACAFVCACVRVCVHAQPHRRRFRCPRRCPHVLTPFSEPLKTR